MTDAVEATREGPQDAKNEGEFVRQWLDALELADREEKDWRKLGDDAVKIYRQSAPAGEGEKARDRKFNILHANVETLSPALYNSIPIPDVRRRFADPDKTSKAVADLLERCISYSVDSYDFDETMQFAVLDAQLPGRAVTRVRYVPYVNGDELAYEEVVCEHVPWKHFRHGPGKVWADVPWIAFELFLTRDELVKLSPDKGNKVQLDAEVPTVLEDKGKGENPKEIFKRGRVWEIWDKESHEIIFIATGFKDSPIRKEADPLKLMGFFPIPRPIYAIKGTDTLVPIVPYMIYRDQAEELERVSQRIMALTEALKAKALYDGRMGELDRLTKADDNELIAVENVAAYVDGGLEKGIMWWPIETIVAAVEKLYLAREQIKQTIYEITGIADILRGQTDPNETLGAQEIKQQWGSLRVQRMQGEVQRYARDLFRLKAEIIATKFQWQTITMMTGLEFPPKAAQQQAMQQVQMAQQQAQQGGQPIQVPPDVQKMLDMPAQEDVESLLRNDAMRGFRVDVESDSTIRADMTRNQNNMNLFLQGTAQYAAAMGPMVMTERAMLPVVMEIYSAFARNFKLGKQAEDALDGVADKARKMAENPTPPPPDPKVEAEKMKLQADQQRMQMEMQFKAQEMQAEMEMKQREHEMKLEMMQADLQAKQMELQLKEREMAMKEREMGLKLEMSQRQADIDAQAQERDAALAERTASLQAESTEHKHELGIEMMDHKAKMAKQQKPQNGARK